MWKSSFNKSSFVRTLSTHAHIFFNYGKWARITVTNGVWKQKEIEKAHEKINLREEVTREVSLGVSLKTGAFPRARPRVCVLAYRDYTFM